MKVAKVLQRQRAGVSLKALYSEVLSRRGPLGASELA